MMKPLVFLLCLQSMFHGSEGQLDCTSISGVFPCFPMFFWHNPRPMFSHPGRTSSFEKRMITKPSATTVPQAMPRVMSLNNDVRIMPQITMRPLLGDTFPSSLETHGKTFVFHCFAKDVEL